MPAVFAVEAVHQSLAQEALKAVTEFGAAAEIAGDTAAISLLAAQGSHGSFAPSIAGAF